MRNQENNVNDSIVFVNKAFCTMNEVISWLNKNKNKVIDYSFSYESICSIQLIARVREGNGRTRTKTIKEKIYESKRYR